MSYVQDFSNPGAELYDVIGNLRWEFTFNDNLIKQHLQMLIFSQYDREAIATELFRQRLEILVAASKSQLDAIQNLGWNVTRRKAPINNHSQSCYSPIQRTIKKKNQKRKTVKKVPPQKTSQINEPVKTYVPSDKTVNSSSMINTASYKSTERELDDDYMYDELEMHL